jgi:hypothetical protein
MPFPFLLLLGTKGGGRQEQGAAQDERISDEIPTRDLHTRHLIASKATGPFSSRTV